MEAAQKLLGVVRDMDYQAVTVWTVIKRFLIGWALAGALLVVVSCVKYKEFIVTAFANNTWAWINAVMPIGIVIIMLWVLIRSFLR